MKEFGMRNGILGSIALLALIAGCSNVAVSGAESDTHTPAEWIPIVEKLAAEEKAGPVDAEFEKVRLGAAICMGHFNGRTDYIKTPRGPKHKAAVEAFIQFMDGPGAKLVEKWRAGEAFSEAEQQYWYVIQGAVLYRGALKDREIAARRYQPKYDAETVEEYKKYVAKVDRNAIAVLRKGYGGGLLTQADIETLRLYKIKQFAKGGDRLLPCMLGYHPIDGSGSTYTIKEAKLALQGTQAMDIKCMYLETALGKPGYSDLFDYEQSVTWPYRPDGVLEFLRPLTGYTMKTEGKKRFCIRRPEYLQEQPGEKPGDYFQLSTRIGKKPIVLIVNDPSDSAFSLWPLTEVIHQAYKDRFEFYYISVSIWDQTMGNPNYFNPFPVGRRGLRNGHYYSVEERARRTKNRYIETPYATFPCALDDMVQTVRTSFLNGGGSNHFTVIDINGKITARGASNMHLYVQWINDLEQSLHATINDKGEYSGAPFSKTYASYATQLVPDRKYLTVSGAVTAVDAEAGTVKFLGKVGKEKRELTATLGRWSRVARGGKVTDVKSIRVGEVCSVVFGDETYYDGMPTVKTAIKGHRNPGGYEIVGKNGRGTCKVRYTMTQLPYTRETCTLTRDTGNGRIAPILLTISAPPNGGNRVWFFGRIKEVLDDGRRISVTQVLADRKDMKGYSLWKAARDWIHLDAATLERMAVIDKWHAKPEAERVYKFTVDDAVGVFLNGKMDGVTHQDLKTGDFVSIEIDTLQVAEAMIFPNAIRISRP
jgi:hypothetical protein